MRFKKRFIFISVLLISLWAIGVIGYLLIEGWSVLDALYMTSISLTTVGYGEVYPLSPAGQIFTIVLITGGVGIFFYAFGSITEALIEGHLKGYMARIKMEKTVEKLKGHFIVCGYGRIGSSIVKIFQEKEIPVVVVEKDPQVVEKIQHDEALFIEGDATLDNTLMRAGVTRAQGVICVLPSDADNVYIILSARTLNPDLLIIARVDAKDAEKKMIMAGADKVISTYEIGAGRMALAALKPTVTDFLDLAVHSTTLDLTIEQVRVEPHSKLDGITLKDAALRQKAGVTVLAIHKPSGQLLCALDPKFVLTGGDVMVAMGDQKGLEQLKALVKAVPPGKETTEKKKKEE